MGNQVAAGADNNTQPGRAGCKQDVMRRRAEKMRVLNIKNWGFCHFYVQWFVFYSKWINEMRRGIIWAVLVCDSETGSVCFCSDTPGVYASDTDWNVRAKAASGPVGVFYGGVDVMFSVRWKRAGRHGWQERPVDRSQIKPPRRFLLFLPRSRPTDKN